MALGTAIYGFVALWISFRLARKYLSEQYAFLATLGIWFAKGLGRPVVFREPVLRLSHGSLRSRPRRFYKLFCARLERPANLDTRSNRHDRTDSVEFWTHLPMGHAPDSRPRPNFLARGGVQSSSGCAGPNHRHPEALRYPQRPLMDNIEQKDVRQLKSHEADSSE